MDSPAGAWMVTAFGSTKLPVLVCTETGSGIIATGNGLDVCAQHPVIISKNVKVKNRFFNIAIRFVFQEKEVKILFLLQSNFLMMANQHNTVAFYF